VRQNLLAVAFLVVLLILLDQLYRIFHPEVNFVRATLVGATGYVALYLLRLAGLRLVTPERGALSIAASAFGSVALIEMGWLTSRSGVSAVVHVVILAIAYLVLAYTRSGSAATRELGRSGDRQE